MNPNIFKMEISLIIEFRDCQLKVKLISNLSSAIQMILKYHGFIEKHLLI
jgi:hypothetical protein